MVEIQMSTLGLVDEWKKPAHGTQYLAALSASMGAMAVGSAIGYSSPASAALLSKPPTNTSDNTTSAPEWLAENDHQLSLTPMENNWFAASLSAGALVGCVVAGFSLNTLGRKGTMLASLVPLMLGWALIGFAQNIGMLVTGRVLCGLCTGITSLVCPTYTTEYASKDIRGALGSGFQLFITIGILYAYLFGAVVESWRWLVLVCAVVGGIYFLLAIFIKESPTFLLSKGKEEEARASMQYFRGTACDISPEVDTANSPGTFAAYVCMCLGCIFNIFSGPLSGYISSFRIYTGQDKGDTPVSSKVVIDLMRAAGLLGKGYEVHTDNWYTSPCLFHYLPSRWVSSVSTVRVDRKCMPRDLQLKARGDVNCRSTKTGMMCLQWGPSQCCSRVTRARWS
ncbi:solute carrier family 2, facilitated glucose transporter member 8-like isoform X2 [Penaeus monodon]|uniref:solute carrier family 2, facilitated glucose transporter member 8-like isoform X2 n=1 Tax=Penaeus monodon TaxID=6687 RepID=UPI0018A701B1|nr:solute carrier family 2, facilitated glucose transporter member 8-like isoform X2 [Penaeus monodon]